jgi:hypothetical protein
LLYPSHPNGNNNLTKTVSSIEKKSTFAADFKKEITKHGKGKKSDGFDYREPIKNHQQLG